MCKYICISQSVQPIDYLKLGYLTNSCDLYTYITVEGVVRTWAYTLYAKQIFIRMT